MHQPKEPGVIGRQDGCLIIRAHRADRLATMPQLVVIGLEFCCNVNPGKLVGQASTSALGCFTTDSVGAAAKLAPAID